jgi:hypothetical protein
MATILGEADPGEKKNYTEFRVDPVKDDQFLSINGFQPTTGSMVYDFWSSELV